ncbi:MAG: C39 family peptidase [Streptococcaceae bacterium]|nr:C39 family peptidase [Streptococcaceae bacterium]
MKFKKILKVIGFAFILFLLPTITFANINMHRLYNINNGEHFYTANTYERDYLTRVGWSYEGIGWVAPSTGHPVYRLYNANSGGHLYTLNSYEKDSLVKIGWKYEGIGWYSGGSIPLHRNYNPNAQAGSHNFTTSKYEADYLSRNGWLYEGIAWSGIGAGVGVINQARNANPKPIYYSQRDHRWTNIKFNDLTIGKVGCVPTSLAMIFNGCLNINLSLVQIAQRMDHLSPMSEGVSGKCLVDTVKSFGRQVEIITTKARADELLAQGYPLIYYVEVKGGGHGIVAYGFSNGLTQIFDPLDNKTFAGWYSTAYLWNNPIKDSLAWNAGRPVFWIK